MKITIFDIIDSTNEYLKNKKIKEEYEIVIAKLQTNGRGKRGSVWISNEGAALFSFVVNSIGQDDKITIFIGYIVRDVLYELLMKELGSTVKLNLTFKWPNDIYYKDRKICGILCEKVENQIIVGIGINVNNTDFGIFNDRATSISLITGNKYSIENIAINVVEKFMIDYNNIDTKWDTIVNEINKYNYLTDKIIIIKENKEYRKYVRVSSKGQIITLDSDGNEHISDALDFEIVST